ncbi:MAG: FHA domain-containing protein [Proteobacteria bacterium]|nr:FHA domain-containing protein [Pseudomonadota bacterium]
MSQVCSHCGMPVKPGFKFCNVCGTQISEVEECLEESVVLYSPLLGPQGRAIRVLTGEQAGEFYRAYPECTIGSGDNADICLEDSMLSPMHARMTTNRDVIMLEDMGALNGIFVRAKDKVLLKDNDIIRAGDHYFLYEFFAPDHFAEEFGTEFYSSPNHGENFRLIEILRGGRRGRACMAPENGIVVGRTEGDFLFPEDTKMSDRHFTIRWTQRGGILIDHSLNGTFVQLHEETRLEEGDLFFAGRTLFRVI